VADPPNPLFSDQTLTLIPNLLRAAIGWGGCAGYAYTVSHVPSRQESPTQRHAQVVTGCRGKSLRKQASSMPRYRKRHGKHWNEHTTRYAIRARKS